MKDKTGAVLRRLTIIPFNARFSKYLEDGVTVDPKYRPYIKYELIEQSSIEYMIRVGMEGLKRIIINNAFTKSEKVQEQLDEYENENNPIKAFIEDNGVGSIENEATADVYKRYLPEMTYKFKYDNTKADSPYRTLRKADQDGTILYFRETDPDKTTLDFGATVSVKRTGGGVNGVIEFEVTMTVQTDITYTDPA